MTTAQKTLKDRRQNFQERLRHAVRKANEPVFAATSRTEKPKVPAKTRPN